MGYYTICMNDNKQLNVTTRINLYQKESLVDKVQFLVPMMYGDFDLREFMATAVYMDVENVPHVEVLVQDEEIYKEKYIRYVLPVDTKLSHHVGEINVYLNFAKADYESGKNYILKTSPAIVKITSVPDYYSIVGKESLDFVNGIVLDLQSKIDYLDQATTSFDETKLDGLAISNEDGKLYGTAKGKITGTGVDVVLPSISDEEDGSPDGVIELDKLYEDKDLEITEI